MEYFEVERLGFAVCSDPACPCPETPLGSGTGYLFMSPQLVEFRRRLRTVADVRAAFAARPIAFGPGTATPIAMCRLGAARRGLDLETAAADFTHWWRTGLAPLRPTPSAAALPEPAAPTAQVRNAGGAAAKVDETPPLTTTRCPHCQVVFRVLDKSLGRQTRCRRCSRVFTINALVVASMRARTTGDCRIDPASAAAPTAVAPAAPASDVLDAYLKYTTTAGLLVGAAAVAFGSVVLRDAGGIIMVSGFTACVASFSALCAVAPTRVLMRPRIQAAIGSANPLVARGACVLAALLFGGFTVLTLLLHALPQQAAPERLAATSTAESSPTPANATVLEPPVDSSSTEPQSN